MSLCNPYASWPGLSRPSTRRRRIKLFKILLLRMGVDGRDKPGHDAQWLYEPRAFACSVRTLVSPDNAAPSGRGDRVAVDKKQVTTLPLWRVLRSAPAFRVIAIVRRGSTG